MKPIWEVQMEWAVTLRYCLMNYILEVITK